ncbi:carboxypeptidase-like regulatory domain-containing protein [bacterium]|nr:carboxypeptidase-like regulatory domain-containing protein [bacterium]
MDISFQSLQRLENEHWLIAGKVTDKQSGSPLVGATVLVAKYRDVNLSITPEENPFLRTGTATDREGYFEIRSAEIKPDDFIIFKYIGFRDRVYALSDLFKNIEQGAQSKNQRLRKLRH